mgnify:FL=1
MEQKEKDSKRLITPAGAGLAAICFFLPWVRACGQDISGVQIANNGESALWFVFIAAIAIVVGFFIYDGQNNLKKLKPLAGVSALISLLILLIKYVQVKGEVGIQYGAVGTLIGFITTLFGLQFLEDSVPDINKSPAVSNAVASAIEAEYSNGGSLSVMKSESNIAESNEDQTQYQRAASNFCSQCGSKLEGGSAFCSECGLLHKKLLTTS